MFSPLYVGLIRAGERSGDIDAAFARLADQLERDEQLRGKVLSVSAPTPFTKFAIGFVFTSAGIPITPQYDVLNYTLVYETITPEGGRTLASGTLLIPVGTTNPLALASYQHGTIARTNDAPGQEVFAGVAFATTGYAAVVPNFLGLGQVSAGLQPYHHARSEATACVDLLRAARIVCAR